MIKFRRLKTSDKKNVEALFEKSKDKIVKIDARSLVKDKNCNCLVIENDKKIIGFGALIIHQVPTKGKMGKIEDIMVDSDYRGHGLGKKMMQELIKIAKNKKNKTVNLTSHPKRVEARKLYVSMGFELLETGVFRLEL
ncbi:MAG: GNAT family N-acetyltransferase [bacterium]|nr:GNAT family N-acetyltransferase [bacterium]